MKRHDDWLVRLKDYVTSAARIPYRPGTHDCILFAAGARAAMTGVDVMAPYKGRYSTLEEGLALARSLGHEAPWLSIVADLVEAAPSKAQVGDIVLLDDEDGIPAMGVVQGESIYVLHRRGLGLVPLLSARRAWRV